MATTSEHITQLLTQAESLGADELAKQLMPLVYDDLHALAQHFLRSERKGHTLQPTALVHEAFLRLVDQSRVDWKGRTHFYAVGAAMMRRVLMDYGRTKKREKRGGSWKRVGEEAMVVQGDLGEFNAIDLNDAFEALAEVDPEQARIVELRFLGGLTVEEVAQYLGVSKRKIEGEWTHAKAWLRSRLNPGSSA